MGRRGRGADDGATTNVHNRLTNDQPPERPRYQPATAQTVAASERATAAQPAAVNATASKPTTNSFFSKIITTTTSSSRRRGRAAAAAAAKIIYHYCHRRPLSRTVCAVGASSCEGITAEPAEVSA